MLALLNIRVWIAIAAVGLFAFYSVFIYRAGAANVRAEWTLSVAQANADSRKLEQQRQRRADEAQSLAVKRASALAADARGARLAVDSLRGAIESSRRVAAQSLAACNKRADTLGELFLESVQEYRSLAETSDRILNDRQMLLDAWPR